MEIEKSKKPKLIIDTNAFIKSLNLNSLAEKYDFLTSESVLQEIKDKSAKEKFSKSLFEIKIKAPSKTSLKKINDFAKKTGDYSILSNTDLELMAIAYTITEENKTNGLLRSEPPKPVNHYPTDKNQNQNAKQENLVKIERNIEEDQKNELEFRDQNEKDSDKIIQENKEIFELNVEENQEKITIGNEISHKNEENFDNANLNQPKSQQILEAIKTEQSKEANIEEKAPSNAPESKEMDELSDDESEWITPANISSHIFTTSNKKEDAAFNLGVAFLTSDFAMQNVLIQLGIPLLTLDGLSIQRTKHWLLECGSCLHLCRDTTKEFCPTCGNHTLTRVSYGVDANGGLILYRKKNYQYRTRGLIYSIPKPKGGRLNNDLILREDEMELKKKKLGIKGRQNEQDRRFKKAQGDFDYGFGFGKVWEGEQNVKYGYGKKNINENRRTKN